MVVFDWWYSICIENNGENNGENNLVQILK